MRTQFSGSASLRCKQSVLLVALAASVVGVSGCKKKDKKPEAKATEKVAEKAQEVVKAPAAEPVQAQAHTGGAEWSSLVALMPAGSSSLLTLDLTALRKSSYWKDIQKAFVQSDEGKKAMAAMSRCGVSEKDLTRVAMGGQGAGFGNGVVVVSGQGIGSSKKIKCILGEVEAAVKKDAPASAKGQKGKKGKAAAKAKAAGPFYAMSKKSGKDAFAVDYAALGLEVEGAVAPAGKTFIFAVDDNHVAFAPEAELSAFEARLAPGVSGLASSLAPLKSKLHGKSALLVTGVPNKDMQDMLTANNVSGVKTYRVGVNLSTGLDLQLDLDMSDAGGAKTAADTLRTKINEQKPMLAFLSLPPTLLDSLKVDAKGSSVRANLHLDNKQIGAVRSAMERQGGGTP